LNAVDRVQDGFGTSLDSHDAEESSTRYSNWIHEGRRNCKEISVYGMIILKRILRKRFLFTL